MINVGEERPRLPLARQTTEDRGQRQRVRPTGKTDDDGRAGVEPKLAQTRQDTLFQSDEATPADRGHGGGLGLHSRVAACWARGGRYHNLVVPTGGIEPPAKGL